MEAGSVTPIATPWHFSPANVLAVGVKVASSIATPGRAASRRAFASAAPSIQGAPSCSNGLGVPRPTLRLVSSRRPTPG